MLQSVLVQMPFLLLKMYQMMVLVQKLFPQLKYLLLVLAQMLFLLLKMYQVMVPAQMPYLSKKYLLSVLLLKMLHLSLIHI